MNVLIDDPMKAVADEKVDRCLVVDALRKNSTALSRDPTLTANRDTVADPEIATNLNRDHKTGSNLVLAAAVDACLTVPTKDFSLPIREACDLRRRS
jgi:hypothetical protein